MFVAGGVDAAREQRELAAAGKRRAVASAIEGMKWIGRRELLRIGLNNCGLALTATVPSDPDGAT